MYSKRSYKICIGSVILEELESRNYKGFSFVLPKILDVILTYYESENFTNPSLHHSFES